MTLRKKPTRAEQKARAKERHEIVRSIMQEPDDIVHFPVAFGRIAMSAALWGAVALGILALGVLSSAVFLMRDEIAGLGKQLQQKDVDLVILSGELQKVRDQMFGEQIQEKQGKLTLRLINAETGVASPLSSVTLKDTPYPLGPESRAVNGKYLYWTDEEGIQRVNLEDGTAYRVVTKPFISSIAVSKDGSWLAYAYSQGLSDPESVGETRAIAMPLAGRGDPIELGQLASYPGDVPKIHGFNADGKELLWTTTNFGGKTEGEVEYTLHRKRISNGQEGPQFKFQENLDFRGFSPDGTVAVALEFEHDDYASRILFIDSKGRRTLRYDGVFHYSARMSWSPDGLTLIVNKGISSENRGDNYMAFPLKGEPKELATLSDERISEILADPEKFLLVVQPEIGSYMYRNLSTGAVASVDGAFTGIAGWSSDLNAVVLLEDTRK